MNLENQVVSLELAKKLKKLGVPQESLFGWQKVGNKYQLEYFESKGYRDVSAYTVAELGELLPWALPGENGGCVSFDGKIYSDKCDGAWGYRVSYYRGDHLFEETDNIEANARAKMLIYLLENKLVTV